MTQTKYNIKCAICGLTTTVNPMWYTYNKHICKNKTCVNVFRALPENIKNQFDIIRKINEGFGYYTDRGTYYSEIGKLIELEFDKNGAIVESNTLFNNDSDLALFNDYQDWIISNCSLEHFERETWHREYYYRYVSLEDNIFPKIEASDINTAIKELLNLERAVSLSKDIINLCNHYNIDTFFCRPTPSNWMQTISLFNK